jgi:PAS domain S-box-containing protein
MLTLLQLKRGVEWFITPNAPFDNPRDKFRARAFLASVLLIIVLVIAFITVSVFLTPGDNSVIFLIILISAYLFARFIAYNIGKYLLTLVVASIAMLQIVFEPNYYVAERGLMIVLMTFMAFSIFANFRMMLWALLFYMFALLWLLPTLVTILQSNIILWYSFLVITFLLMTTISCIYYTYPLFSNTQNLPPEYHQIENLMNSFGYTMRIGTDQSAVIEWTTGGFYAVTHYLSEQFQAKNTWQKLIHAEDLLMYQIHLKQIFTDGKHTAEYRLLTPQGGISWVRDTGYLSAKNSEVTRIYGAIHDITPRVEAEESLRSHIVQQAVVAELGLLALTYDDSQTLMEHAVVLCEQVLGVSVCEILTYDSTAQTYRVLATAGLFQRESDTFTLPADSSPVQQALITHEMVMVNDVAGDNRYKNNAYFRKHNILSSLTVVIHAQTDPMGVISVYRNTAHKFNDDDVYFLQSIANVISTFHETTRARLGESAQAHLADAMREATNMVMSQLDLQVMLDRILAYLVQIIPNQDASTIMLLNKVSGEMEFASNRGYEDSIEKIKQSGFKIMFPPKLHLMVEKGYYIIDDVTKSDEWIKNDETMWVRSYLGAPIMVNIQCIGLINLDSAKVGVFNDKDGKNLQAFADKAGIAIQNAKRAEELEKLVAERTEQLKYEQAQLQAILDATGEGIYYTENGRILFANHAFYDMTGYEREDIIGKFSTILHPHREDTEQLYLSKETLTGILNAKIWRDEGTIIRKDGSHFIAGLTTSRLDSDHTPPEQKLFRAVTVVRDISRQKEFEDQQQRFISHAAHELRTPITNLNTRLYFIEKYPQNMDEHIDILKRVITRMNRLVSDLLDMSYIEHGRIQLHTQTIIIQEVIHETLILLRPEANLKNIDFETIMPDASINLLADPHRLQQVFTNLIVNAINYTPNEGKIRVFVSVTETHCKIEIADSGRGIPPNAIALIFQPFYRVEDKTTGTGLGLTIAREIVQLHHGTLTVESQVGKGSNFVVQLPLGTYQATIKSTLSSNGQAN